MSNKMKFIDLTELVKIKEIKDKFREWFFKPHFIKKGRPIIHPLMSNNPSLVGTAFDYLFRFYIMFMNPRAVSDTWVAEKVLRNVSRRLNEGFYTSKSEKKGLKAWLKEGTTLLNRAKENHANYIEDGVLTSELLESCLHLAKIGSLYTPSGYIKSRVQDVDSRDVEELKALINGVKEDKFKAKELCILNPGFTNTVIITGIGGEADLLLDDKLIDIKTIKDLRFDREIFNQIMGYYLLSKIGGIDHAPKNYNIQKIGVYYPRHEYLHIVDIEDIFDLNNLGEIINCFITKTRDILRS